MYGTRDVSISPEVPAAPFATLAAAKEFLGVADASADARLTSLLATASVALENYCGRPIAQRTVTEILDPEEVVSVLVLSRFPVISLTSVAFDDVAQTPADFRLSRGSGTLRRVDGQPFTAEKLTIVYEAGYAAIPPPVAEACSRYAASLYNSKAQRLAVAAEAVPDLASVTYGSTGGVSRNGVVLPFDVAGLLAAYVTEFAL